jgi:hypothetical protein
MPKRVRTSSRPTSHRRPGTRPQNRTKPRDVRPVSQLESAAVIADDLVEDRPAEAAAEMERAKRATYQSHRVKAGSILAAKAASEYVYVAQDMRRIALVAVALFGVLLVAWLLVVVLRVIPLPFY